MKWDLYIADPKTSTSKIVVRDYPKTTKADQGAVAQIYAHEAKIKADLVLALPHHDEHPQHLHRPAKR